MPLMKITGARGPRLLLNAEDPIVYPRPNISLLRQEPQETI